MTSNMSQTVWIEAQQQWVSSQDLSYHPCLKVRILQPFGWPTSAWGISSTWATFRQIHMQTAELLLQDGWGHWSIVVEVFHFLVIHRSYCSQPLFKEETSWWTFVKLAGISNTLKGISSFLTWHNHHPNKHVIFFMVLSTKQIHLCPCPFSSTFTYMFIAPGGHKILPPVLRCVSKLEQGRSVPVLTSEHLWNCWYGALERSWLWPQRLNKAQL